MPKANQIKKSNKFYVTTSIAYANAKPHVGYAMELIQADTLARYYQQKGWQTYFLTGTDEHGQKLKDAAEKENLDTQSYVDKLSQTFRDLTRVLKLRNDKFVRTTDKDHKQAAQKLWRACKADIYKSKYSGLYCVGHEAFLKKEELIDGVCPDHKTTPKEIEIESYFFRLSKFAKQLSELIESGQLKIVPEKRKNEMLSFIESGLEDVSISRPKTQLEWGVEVPDDSDHVMYVWFDALTNYISAIGYRQNTDLFQQLWPADVHIIGKDIARFHCLLWPAMLISAGLETPRSVFVHSFITSGGLKMSKTIGNVIDPVEYAQTYDVEALRYYLLRYIPSYDDGDFTEQRFKEVYDADLANTLGNLISRVVVMLNKYNNGIFQQVPVEAFGVEDYISKFRFDRCLEEIFSRISKLNATIDEKKPWELFKTDPTGTVEILNTIVSEILHIAEVLTAFMPETAEKIKKTFFNGKVDTSIGILFPRVET